MKLRLIILALGNFVVGTGSLVIAGILPKVAQDLKVSITAAGQLVTIYALTYAVAAPLLAAFTGKIGRRLLLILALSTVVAATVIAAISPTFEIVFVARMLAAAGGALYTPTSSVVAVSIAPPEERGRALALVFAGLPVATVLGLPFGTFIGSNFGWRVAFWLVALIGIIGIVAILVSIKSLAPTPPISLRQWAGLLKQRQLLVALSVTFWQYAAQFLAFTYIAPLLQQNTHLDGNGISLMLFVFGLAGVIGNSLGGVAADRWNLTRALGIILSGLALTLFTLSPATTSLIGAGINLFLWGLSGFVFNPVQQTRLIKFVPEAPGLMLSLNSSMLYLGNAAGAGLGGIVVSGLGVGAVGWLGGLITLIALAALLLSAVIRDQPSLTSVPSVAD